MSLTPLITTDEAIAGAPRFANLSPGEQASLILAATSAINRECDRILGAAAYSQVYTPERTREVRLKQCPVSAVTRVATDLYPILTVRCTSGTVQRASVAYTTTGPEDDPAFTGLTLASVASGVAATHSLPFSTCRTVGALAAAIDALGDGWTATIQSPPTRTPAPIDFARWATADLNGQVGAMDAFSAPLNLVGYVRDLPFRLIPDGEWTRVIELFEGRPSPFRYPDKTSGPGAFSGSPMGPTSYDPDYGTVRVDYSAGWSTATVPGDLKEQAILAVQFFQSWIAAESIYKSRSVGKVSYTINSLGRLPLPDYICTALISHRRTVLV